MSTNLNMEEIKVTIFILKGLNDIYGYSYDKDIIEEFKSLRCMDNFIVKKVKMERSELKYFDKLNYEKKIHKDYLYDGKNTISFPMTSEESMLVDTEVNDVYERIGEYDLDSILYRCFKGKYNKALSYILDVVNSYYYNADKELNSLNAFIKLFKHTLYKERKNTNNT